MLRICRLTNQIGARIKSLYFKFQAQAKFDTERAQTALDWAEQMIGQKLDYPEGAGIRDSLDFGALLKDGKVLCQ